MTILDEVRRVKASVEGDLMKRPGVTGVSVGYKYTGGKKTSELSIRVYVEKKKTDLSARQQIPKTMQGVKTDVMERRFVPRPRIVSVAELEPNADTSTYDPLKGGISIGPCRIFDGFLFVGTLGVIVTDNTSSEPMMLSNFHVLAVDNNWNVGDTMAQPSPADGGNCPADVVGTLQRASIGDQVDCAVARITARGNTCEIVDIGIVNGTTTATLDMAVSKRGRTTGLTSGTVDSIDATISVPYPKLGTITFTNQFEILANTPLIVVESGFFISVTWSTAPSTTASGITIERDNIGTVRGITVTGPTGSLFHQTNGSNVSRYMVFGSNNYVLILESTTQPGSVTHTVTVVNVTNTPPTEKLILTGLASSASIPPPRVHHAQGTGTAFMIYNSTGTQIQNLAIYRSDDGESLCPGSPPFVPTGETRAEANETELVIHYSSGGTSRRQSCPLFSNGMNDTFGQGGDSGSVVVDDARRVVGLFFASSEEVTDDDGNILVPEGAIGIANPIEAVLDTLDVNICMPGGGGSIVQIGFRPTSIFFDVIVEDGVTQSKATLYILNNGEENLNVSVESSSGPVFQWDALKGEVIRSRENRPLEVTFTPPAVGFFNAALIVESNEPSSPHSINVNGSARSAIRFVPSFLSFGKVKVRRSKTETLTIKNEGKVDHSVFVPASLGIFQEPVFQWNSLINEVIQPQESRFLSVTFKPPGEDFFHATLSAVSDAHGSPHSINLSGTGAVPIIGFRNTKINFDKVAIGDVRTRTLIINNNGEVDLRVSLRASPHPFFLWNALNDVVTPGEDKRVLLDFVPRAEGGAETTLIVESDARGSPHSINLSGTGIRGEPL